MRVESKPHLRMDGSEGYKINGTAYWTEDEKEWKSCAGENFPVWLLALRKHLGISQVEMARLFSVHSNTVARWERSEQRPADIYISTLKHLLLHFSRHEPWMGWRLWNSQWRGKDGEGPKGCGW